MWRSEDEMLEVVRQRARDRRRRHRFLTATASVGVVVAVAVGAAALGGDGSREISVAGSVGGGGGGGGVSPVAGQNAAAGELPPLRPPESFPPTPSTTGTESPSSQGSDPYVPPPAVAAPRAALSTTTTVPELPSAPASTPVSPDTPVSSPVLPPPSGPVTPSPTRVPVKPNAVDLRARPFESSAVVGPSSVAVRFWGGVAPCDVVGRVDVAETATTVTITVYRGREAGPEMACIAIASYQEVLVELSSPLAGRTIVDGAA